jgi:DNA-binding LacI/PurR family transcriptional regulator
VKEQTREMIEQAAREMGYRPRNVTTHTIGYVVTSLHYLRSQLEQEILIAGESALRRHGFHLTLINAEPLSKQAFEDVVNLKTVDGVLLSAWEGGRFESLIAPQIPYLLLSEEEVGPHVEQICVDFKGTFANILRYLLGFGHERIAALMGRSGKSFYLRMSRAAKAAALEQGDPRLKLRVIGAPPLESAPQLIKLLREPEPPTAVIVADYQHALSVYCDLLTHGLRIPQDVSLVSVCDSREFPFLKPPITATSAGGCEIMDLAVERLMGKINMPETIPHHRSLPGSLIERGSVGPVRR